MTDRSPLPRALILGLLLSAALPAFAEDSAAPADPAPAAAEAPAEARPVPPSNCLTQTGSRLKRRGDQCLAGAGRVVTREDLERSGRIDVQSALRQTVPTLH